MLSRFIRLVEQQLDPGDARERRRVPVRASADVRFEYQASESRARSSCPIEACA